MPRLPAKTPWLLVIQAALEASAHWRELPERDRVRIRDLLAKSRGRPGNLTERDRAELRALLRRADLGGLARRMLPLARKRKPR